MQPHSHTRTSPALPGTRPTPVAEAECRSGPKGVLIRVRGEIDLDTVHVIEDALQATTEGRTIVDLSHVGFADSALLHALLNARADHRLVLAGPLPRHLRRLFDLSNTRRYFTFTPHADTGHPA
ncbi:STAS domain-containing protein [Streptomyces sp. NPDC006326]|uniref:STAS domain-containing protein n=1 Tax=Streptomyces sp. NPDC006326 TaxID=3156752 RepID=UPI0033BDA184